MGAIIIPGSPTENPRPYLELANSPRDYKRVMQAFVQVLEGSFLEDERRYGKGFVERIHTKAEEKRRADIIGRWFREMRAGLGFSLNRALDELPRALRTELDGGSYTPPEGNTLWAPGGA